MDVSYERFLHVLAIASSNDMNDECLRTLQLRDTEVTDRNIIFRFSNYVKSQIHFYMQNTIGNKSFLQYTNAFYYLNGDSRYRKDALELLRCFYTDIASFLLHSTLDLNVSLQIDIDLPEVWEANVSEIRQSLLEMFSKSELSDEDFKQYLDTSKYAWLFDYISSPNEGKQRINNYSLAIAILDMLEHDEIYKFEEVRNAS